MKFDLIQTTAIITVVLSCIIGFNFIQTRKEKVSKNTLLSALLFTYALMIICSLILSASINSNLFAWAHIGNQSVFLVGPLLYFYVKSRLNPSLQITKAHILHSIPFITATAYLIIKFYFIPMPITCRSNHIMIGSIAFVHSLGYFYFSILELNQSGLSIQKAFNQVKENKLAFLPFLVYGCFSIWLTKLLFFLVWDISGYYNGCNEIISLYFLVSFTILSIFTYFILLKPQYFQKSEKYKHSGLTHTEKLNLKTKLISLMEKDKVYLDPLISLNRLAKQLSVPSRHLSQVINETMNQSFYDLINCYRIKDCVNYLSDSNNSQKTILEIAYEVGFNSKSTFNTSFAKNVGVTPKEFRKNHANILNQRETVFA